MGTLSFSVSDYGRRGTTVQSSKHVTSGAYTTSTSASNVEDAGGDITLAKGQVMICHADEAMRIRFGSVAATASTGHYIPAGAQREFEVTDAGFASVIDVA